IAAQYGVDDWRLIWNAEENTAVRTLRGSERNIQPGDAVMIPPTWSPTGGNTDVPRNALIPDVCTEDGLILPAPEREAYDLLRQNMRNTLEEARQDMKARIETYNGNLDDLFMRWAEEGD